VQGKRIFRDALDDGSVESFFPLVQHFQTQSEPASCALGTLCMVRRDV
jgi:glutathione gamma-glutamylcysteinyltransferase